VRSLIIYSLNVNIYDTAFYSSNHIDHSQAIVQFCVGMKGVHLRVLFSIVRKCNFASKSFVDSFNSFRYIKAFKGRESVVHIATGYGLDDRGPWGRSSSRGRFKNYFFSTSSRPALGSAQPPIQWISGALSPVVKRPGRESDHSIPASAEVKKIWIYTSTPSYTFMV
jgi:hypothetical protein